MCVARHYKNAKNGDYVTFGRAPHVCEWRKYDIEHFFKDRKRIELPNYKTLSGLPPQQPPKRGCRPCPPKVDKSRITKSGDFELQWSKYGKPDGKLVIFCPENKKLCYEMGLESKNYYRCNKCKEKEKIQVTARLYYDEKNQPYLIHGENDHILTEYTPDNVVLYPSEYHVTQMDENENPIKFVIFTDSMLYLHPMDCQESISMSRMYETKNYCKCQIMER
uniref:Uncharacterized protein n=1 Tax=Panagrolaimus sp. ES5 TaxID=591445 RepID=A0AC34G426_9BILA